MVTSFGEEPNSNGYNIPITDWICFDNAMLWNKLSDCNQSVSWETMVAKRACLVLSWTFCVHQRNTHATYV